MPKASKVKELVECVEIGMGLAKKLHATYVKKLEVAKVQKLSDEEFVEAINNIKL